MRVGALLEMPELRLSACLGGALLDREISHVYSTELPDPGRYLSGGELVVSGLLWWHRQEDAERFVRALAEHDACALAASGADLGGIPDALVRACERHQLALIEVPPDLSFAVITERVVLALAAGRGGVTLGPQRRLLATVAGGGGLDALLRSGEAELAAPCWVRTATGRVVAGQPSDSPYTAVDVPNRSSHAVLPWSLVVASSGSGWQADQRAVAAELAGLVGLERARTEQQRSVEDRAAAPLLRMLAAGAPSITELTAQLANAGISAGQHLRAISASSAGGHTAGLVALLRELLAEFRASGPVGAVDEQVYALATAERWPEDAANSAMRVLRLAGAALGGERVLVGISGIVTMAGLPGAVEEARHAMRLGERRGGTSSVVFSEEIPAHRLLLAGTPVELRRSLRLRLLGPLLDYDSVHGSDLLGTLRTFLECSGSWTLAARRLHVHVNTLRYRIGRVEQLLGTDISEFTNRVDIYLALHAER